MNELMVTIAYDFWTWFGLPPEPVGEQLDADEKALGVDRRRYLQRLLMARYHQVLEGAWRSSRRFRMSTPRRAGTIRARSSTR